MARVSSLYPGYSSVKALPRERKNGQIHNSFCPPAAGGDRVLSMDVTSVAWARPLHPDRPWLRPGSNVCCCAQGEWLPLHGCVYSAAFTRGGGRRGGGDRVRGRGLGARGGNQPRPRLLPTQTRSRVEARHQRGRARGCDSGQAGLCRLPGCACDDPVHRLLPPSRLCVWRPRAPAAAPSFALPRVPCSVPARAAPPPPSPSRGHRGQHVGRRTSTLPRSPLPSSFAWSNLGVITPQVACAHGCNSSCRVPPPKKRMFCK